MAYFFIDKTLAWVQKWFIRSSDSQTLIWSIAASKTQRFKVLAFSPLPEKRALIALQGSQCEMQAKGEYSWHRSSCAKYCIVVVYKEMSAHSYLIGLGSIAPHSDLLRDTWLCEQIDMEERRGVLSFAKIHEGLTFSRSQSVKISNQQLNFKVNANIHIWDLK